MKARSPAYPLIDEMQLNEQQQLTTGQFSITGMNCAACAARIEKALQKKEGISEAAVSYAFRTAWVQYDTRQITIPKLLQTVEKLGFHASANQTSIESIKQEKNKLKTRLLCSLLLAIPLLLSMTQHVSWLHFIAESLPPLLFHPWLQLALGTIIQFVIAMPFYFGAFHALRQRSANMDVLVVLGTSTAYFYSHYVVFQNELWKSKELLMAGIPLYFETSAVVITAILLGKYIESAASLKAHEANSSYNDLANKLARVLRKEKWQEVRSEFVRKGELVEVREGEIIPVDGLLLEGCSTVEESLLTGESKFIEKNPGQQVWAGTKNGAGKLTIQTNAAGYDTLLSQIEELVRKAQRSKANIQRQVDRIAAIFVPIIMLIATLTLLLWGIWLDTGNWQHAVLCMVAVLLVACPCALGLAAPLSLVLASGRLAKQGVVVKDASALERLAAVDTIVFDKTGTLTTGTPIITQIIALGMTKHRLLSYAAAAEMQAEHPLAKAIVSRAVAMKLQLPQAENSSYIASSGVKAQIDGHLFMLGHLSFLKLHQINPALLLLQEAEKREANGETVLFAAWQNRCAGFISFRDPIKEEAAELVFALRNTYITSIMATGDGAAPAHAIAAQAGIEQVYASQTAASKLELVRQLQQHGKQVAMIGDGWNDAPSLAAADVGIAMGSGTTAALHAGHITLLYSRLKAVTDVIAVSKLTIANVKQNLGFAFLYNMLMLPLAIAGLLQPWMAGIAMALSSISVVSNALRLKLQMNRRYKGAAKG
ncbi:heavy metal translocating P-type ATPase [Paenibacillus sp. GXUN7292]|uniref:heavy metal translocating P-type ATPase n=1 Tax=Paenibacillus sp. GXUN7292 TaxID=3422499 RepID=UPI003D7D468B